ncbi:MAG: outer membrane beta-barrel protein [Phreatobacter sp.]
MIALVLAWAGVAVHGQALRGSTPSPGAAPLVDDPGQNQGWRGLAPIESDSGAATRGGTSSDADAAGLRTEMAPAPPGTARTDAAGRDRLRAQNRRAPWIDPSARRPGTAPAAGIAAPAPAATPSRVMTSRPALVANRRTGRMPRRPAASDPATVRQSAGLPAPARRPPQTSVINLSREDRRALGPGGRGVVTPVQPLRPVDVPLVTDRTQAVTGRALPNANPLGRNAVVDPVTGEVISFARTPAVEADPFAPTGLRLGTFVVTPTADVTLGYDSNPRRLHDGAQGSLFTQSYGEVQARSDWSRHELTARLRGTYSAYFSDPDVNRPEVNAVVTGRVDLARTTRIDTEARYNLSAQSPGSSNLPSDPGSSLKNLPLVRQYGGTAALVQDLGRLQLTLRGSVDRYTYDDAVTNNGTIIPQGNRNYNAYGLRLRASYELTPGLRPFVEVGVERHGFDTPISPTGILQGSTSTSYRVGSTFELTRLITGEVAAGYLVRDNLDPTLADIRVPTFDAALIWTATALTTVRFGAKSVIDETFTTGAAGIQRRDFSIELEHSFRRWLIGTAKLAYGQDVYVGNPRVDQRLIASVNLIYRASRNLQIRGEARREMLMSNQPGQSYSANIFLLGLRLQR